VDWNIDERWAFNVDVKKAALSSSVSTATATLTEAQLNPWLYAVGVRYGF
jgi:outer membrane protein